MILAKMRYKGYVWNHNPETLKVTTEQKLIEQTIPQGKETIQDFGVKSRVISGSGQLFGEDCLYQYEKLLELQNESGSGILSLPDTKPFYAYFKSIELACDPAPDIITYNFQFIEDLTRKAEKIQGIYHTLTYGQTLWDVSYIYSVSMEDLLELNPDIKRVDELVIGDKVRVC